MKKNIQQLSDKLTNKTVFIIGGGPSVVSIDMDLLDNELTIGINNSYKLLPHATALYWSDASWVDKHMTGIMEHKCQLRFHARHGSCYPNVEIKSAGRATVLSRTAEMGYDPNPQHVCGNNGGAHAINLAVNMGAKNIVLLGYDMSITDDKSHWHDGHGRPPNMYTKAYNELFIPSINSMAKRIKELRLNVNIVNATLDSKLKCFPFEPFEKYLT